jgi:Zn-dependent protease
LTQPNPATPAVANCVQCGTELAPHLLACPQCGRLLYSDRLTALADAARAAVDVGDISSALGAWREALALLPPTSKQAAMVAQKITELDALVSGAPAGPDTRTTGSVGRAAAAVGGLGLLAWKLKALFLGFGKASTVLSMLLSLGVYWTLWGWKFALGLVLSIYVHEMGHVIALRRYGFKATAPMFIPGLGAVVRLQQRIVNPLEDAAIGLAGPIYGLGAALFTLGLWALTKQPIFAAIAGVAAWVNLFNLVPFASLDGGRGFNAMSRTQKWLATAAVAVAWYFTDDGLLILIGVLCIGRALAKDPPGAGSWKATITYVVLVGALSAMATTRFLAEGQ